MNKTEIDMIITTLTAVISLLTALDPAIGQSKVVQDIQAAIASLQALGI